MAKGKRRKGHTTIYKIYT